MVSFVSYCLRVIQMTELVINLIHLLPNFELIILSNPFPLLIRAIKLEYYTLTTNIYNESVLLGFHQVYALMLINLPLCVDLHGFCFSNKAVYTFIFSKYLVFEILDQRNS